MSLFSLLLLTAVFLPFAPCFLRGSRWKLKKRIYSGHEKTFQNIQEIYRELDAGKITESEAAQMIQEYEREE